jgi:hypothetical protein
MEGTEFDMEKGCRKNYIGVMHDPVEKIALWIRLVRRAVTEILRPASFLSSHGSNFDAVIRHLRHVRSSGPYTRDQMNER